jgi:hypothetical protein
MIAGTKQGDKRWRSAVVSATTLTNGVPLTVTYSEAFASADQFAGILEETKRLVSAIVDRNEGDI